MYKHAKQCSVLAGNSRRASCLLRRAPSLTHGYVNISSHNQEKTLGRQHLKEKSSCAHSDFYRLDRHFTVPDLVLCDKCCNDGHINRFFSCDSYQKSDSLSSLCSQTSGISPLHLKYSTNSDHKHFSRGVPWGCYSSLLSQTGHNASLILVSPFHTSSSYFKEESKVEQTVKALKDEKKKTESALSSDTPSLTTEEKVVTPSTDKTAAVTTPKKSLWERFKAELVHYYHGFRLLFIDIKVCARLLWAVLNGKSLSRRERNQLVRTTADMFRLVPFLVFVIVPFMEFLLPVAIKLFPNMLPSTFQEANKEQEKLRKKLKVKLEMAKFLQDTIEETAVQKKGARGEKVQEFAEFMNKIRTLGMGASNEEIMKYSKLFEDEITLDNLSHAQLRALCNLLEVGTSVGTSNLLRFQIRMKLRQLEADDKMIQKEGVDSLTVWELQAACRARGMRALGVPEERLKSQLNQWLALHLEEKIPTSLLLLSRALYLPDTLSAGDQLKATISALSDSTGAAEEAKVKISEVSGDRVDNKAKLEVIQQEEEIIRLEAAEKKEEEEKLEAEKAAVAAAAAEQEVKKPDILEDIAETVAKPITPSIVDSAPEIKPGIGEVMDDKAEVIEDKIPAEEVKEEEEISSSELETMEEALEAVAKEHIDHVDLETLKTDVSEYRENLEDLKEVVVATGEELSESKAAKRLSKHVDRMIAQMDHVTNKLNQQKDELLEAIEVREVKIKRNRELQEDSEAREEVLQVISEKKKHLVDINELLLAVKRLQKTEVDTRLQKVVEVLDADCDGKVDVSDALKVIEHLGRENVKITTDQMTEILDIMEKEEQIEKEEKEAKVREKQEKQEKLKEEELAGKTEKDNDSSETQEIEDAEPKKESQKQ